MADQLAEIDGITPKVLLTEDEEREVKSTTSKSSYKVKRTFDHYYCTCPAWRNQSKVPTNARTCKHLKSLLGDAYEDARIKFMNPDGAEAAPASKSKTKAAPKGKKGAKAKVEEPEGGAETATLEPPVKPPSSRRTSTKRKKEESDDEAGEKAEADPPARRSERVRARSQSVEPAAAKAKPPSSRRGAKRQKIDSEAEEEKPAKPASKRTGSKPPSKRASSKPPSKRASSKPPSKRGQKAQAADAAPELAPLLEEGDVEMKDEDEDAEADAEMKDGEEEVVKATLAAAPAGEGEDELAEINGIKPLVYLRDGEETEVKSQSSRSTYKAKRTWDHYYCTCPAWRNQGGAPTNARTCKHLKALLGEEYENARVMLKNPDGPAPTTGGGKKKPRSKAADKAKKVDLLLANKWDLETGPDPTGWWISEKLDGVRTFYDGEMMYSRLGNPFTPPKWLLEKLPKDLTLDGELFGGRGQFQSTVSIVKTVNSPHWQNITFQVFDIPSKGSEPFEDRLAHLESMFGPGGQYECKEVVVVKHTEAESREHVLEQLKEIEGLGGEGLMLRKPQSHYEATRSNTLLKIKTFYDGEAEVIGYEPGKGKHKGATGSLKCRMESGKTFNVGTGLSDKQRKDPPQIGSIIVYRFQELTRDGVPRFPSFIGEAVDKDSPKDAEIPEHRKKEMMGANNEAEEDV